MVTRSGAAVSVPDRWARPSAATPPPASASPSGAPTVTRPGPASPRSAGAGIPETWDCPRCGLPAGQDAAEPAAAPPKVEPYKTHLAYVKERRSDADGEAILDEALQHAARPWADPLSHLRTVSRGRADGETAETPRSTRRARIARS